MMEDWTDIISKGLESIEESLPADDWNVLQQKYAAAQKRKKVAAFAWIGGFTSVAAALALVLLLGRPDTSSVTPDHTAQVIPDQTVHVTPESSGDLAESVVKPPVDIVQHLAPSVQKQESAPVDVVKNTAADVLVADNQGEDILYKEAEEIIDVIRDTTSLKEKFLADAQPTGTFGFEDFPEDEQKRKRRRISIGISGATSGSPVMNLVQADLTPEMPEGSGDMEYPGGSDFPRDPMEPEAPPEVPDDSVSVKTPQQAMAIMKRKGGYSDSYKHEVPVSIGISARYFFTDRLSINTGLNYTRYKSLRTRTFAVTHDQQKDWQHAHYLGIPVRIDFLAVNRKHFNLYLGAGMQMDKCVYAKVGDERLHEKQFLFGVNGAMGLQVNIVPMVGLYFEPEFSYALNEGSIETFRSDKPFVITVRAGLRFNF